MPEEECLTLLPEFQGSFQGSGLGGGRGLGFRGVAQNVCLISVGLGFFV